MEKGLNEMMEQKNRLAYDKGRLQNRVDDLQREVESLANSQSEATQLRKVSSSLESNFKKVLTIVLSHIWTNRIVQARFYFGSQLTLKKKHLLMQIAFERDISYIKTDNSCKRPYDYSLILYF